MTWAIGIDLAATVGGWTAMSVVEVEPHCPDGCLRVWLEVEL